ncbi:MAG: hypothetical protein KDA99_06390, partial [Planctomycetales bacterium]|nr:hypothetical protein [Planctomycetales bacterium]
MALHLKKRWIDRRVYEYFAVNVAPYLGWRDPILVYQMGKVGSSSIRNSLFRCPDVRTRLVLMSHEFLPIRNRRLSDIEIEPEYRDYCRQEIEHDRRVFDAFDLRKKLGWRLRERFYAERIYQAYVKKKNKLRVITLVREPIANNISMFFEVFDHYADTRAEESSLSVEAMIELFLMQYVHGRPLTWLDAELKRMLDVDVYQYPFDLERGCAMIESGNVDLLVLKCELPDDVKAKTIAEFLKLEKLELTR